MANSTGYPQVQQSTDRGITTTITKKTEGSKPSTRIEAVRR